MLKTGRVSFTIFTSVALYLITPQVFSGCLATVYPLINKPSTFWTAKCILLGQIIKAVLFRRAGKLNSKNISGDSQQFQAAMNSAGIVAGIQCNVLHWIPVLNLALQMP